MNRPNQKPYVVDTIAELHQLFQLPAPTHPLISVIDLKDRQCLAHKSSNSLIFNFYSIWIKNDPAGKLGYGQNFFNFNTGKMTFQAPGQVISVYDHHFSSGWGLILHPDFFHGFALAKNIKEYAYFSYAVFEGLHLTDEEENQITHKLKEISDEYSNGSVNLLGQRIIIAHIELLLAIINRIYFRQFSENREVTNHLLIKVEEILDTYFAENKLEEDGLPTVGHLANKLYISPHYLSDTLKRLTGQNAQQHIQNKLLNKAKEMLVTSNLSVSEIGYQMGFGHTQSFSKFFKSKAQISPLEFRQQFKRAECSESGNTRSVSKKVGE